MEKPKVSHLATTKKILRYIKGSWSTASCFKHLTKKAGNYLDTLSLICVLTKMIENQLHGTSSCMEKHQYLGAQERTQLWHSNHVKLSTLWHLRVLVKLCG